MSITITIKGNVVDRPEIHQNRAGDSSCTFIVISHQDVLMDSGELMHLATPVQVSASADLAVTLCDSLRSGALVIVRAHKFRAETRSQELGRRAEVVIVADEVELVSDAIESS